MKPSAPSQKSNFYNNMMPSKFQRFPSIQPDEKKINALITSDILSHTSRLSKVSQLVSKNGGDQNLYKKMHLPNPSSKYGENPDSGSIKSQVSTSLLVDPTVNMTKIKNNSKLLQEEILIDIIQKRKQKELEKSKILEEEKLFI